MSKNKWKRGGRGVTVAAMTASVHIRRLLVGALVAGAALAASGGVASASAFKPRGIYDCSVLQAATGIRVYVTTVEFKSGHRYSNGTKASGSSLSNASTGKYKRAGSKIIPLSGRLKKLHESLLIQRADLAVLDSNGHFTSLGCYLRPNGHQTTPSSDPPSGGSGFPAGNYTCYHTLQQPNGSFGSQFAAALSFWSDGTYGSPRGDAWSQQGDTINFTAGPYWTDINFRHDVGTWVPGGVAMPHASGTMTGNQYTLVIRSTRPNELNPPMTEFSGSYPESYNYCKL
jgi:hypothetical protein